MDINEFILKNGKHPIYEDSIQEMDIDVNLCLNRPFYIKEGLIRTYPIGQTVDSLAKLLRFKVCSNESDCLNCVQSIPVNSILPSGAIAVTDGNNGCKCITVVIEDNENNKSIIDKRLNTCGYFEAYSKRFGDWMIYRYEAKFDIKVTDIVYQQPYLYHICPSILEDKILKNGLVPKESKWPGFKNDSRIYLFLKKFSNTQLNNAVNHFQMHKLFGGSYLYIQIDVSKLPDGMKFYTDPRMFGAVYTNDNVPPYALEIIENCNGY